MIGNILDNTTELYMIKYAFGETFSSGRATLCKNPSDQTVLYGLHRNEKISFFAFFQFFVFRRKMGAEKRKINLPWFWWLYRVFSAMFCNLFKKLGSCNWIARVFWNKQLEVINISSVKRTDHKLLSQPLKTCM